MDYDPQPALSKVTCPVLALNGAKDMQVDAGINLKAIEAAARGQELGWRTQMPLADHACGVTL